MPGGSRNVLKFWGRVKKTNRIYKKKIFPTDNFLNENLEHILEELSKK